MGSSSLSFSRHKRLQAFSGVFLFLPVPTPTSPDRRWLSDHHFLFGVLGLRPAHHVAIVVDYIVAPKLSELLLGCFSPLAVWAVANGGQVNNRVAYRRRFNGLFRLPIKHIKGQLNPREPPRARHPHTAPDGLFPILLLFHRQLLKETFDGGFEPLR